MPRRSFLFDDLADKEFGQCISQAGGSKLLGETKTALDLLSSGARAVPRRGPQKGRIEVIHIDLESETFCLFFASVALDGLVFRLGLHFVLSDEGKCPNDGYELAQARLVEANV